MFKLTPIEAAEAKNLNKRTPHKVNIRNLYFPLTGGKNYGLYTKVRKHVLIQIQWMTILSTDELFRIKEAIKNGLVPNFFEPIVNEIYAYKQRGEFVISLTIGDNKSKFPVFDYENKEAWSNPGIPTNTTFNTEPVGLVMPKPKVTVPSVPQSAINILRGEK